MSISVSDDALPHQLHFIFLFVLVWVGPLVVKELKRIVETSEIIKYVLNFSQHSLRTHCLAPILICREDDANWPKKNVVGKQELEIRIGSDHIAFEVCVPLRCRLSDPELVLFSTVDCQNRVSGGCTGQRRSRGAAGVLLSRAGSQST